MADTLTNIELPKNTWVDLYSASGVEVGTQILIENTGVCDVLLSVQASEPEQDSISFNVLKRDGDPLQNQSDDVGAWAMCPNTDGQVNINPLINRGFAPPSAFGPSSAELSELTILEKEFRRSLLAMLGSVEREMHLLNLRFEEAFETDIEGTDL